MLSRFTFAALALFAAGVFLYTGATHAQGQDAKVLVKGEFHKAEKAGKGTATVYKLADGKRVLRLTDFSVENGPDLHVRLIAADDAKDTASVAKDGPLGAGQAQGQQGQPELRPAQGRGPEQVQGGLHLVQPLQRQLCRRAVDGS